MIINEEWGVALVHDREGGLDFVSSVRTLVSAILRSAQIHHHTDTPVHLSVDLVGLDSAWPTLTIGTQEHTAQGTPGRIYTSLGATLENQAQAMRSHRPATVVATAPTIHDDCEYSWEFGNFPPACVSSFTTAELLATIPASSRVMNTALDRLRAIEGCPVYYTTLLRRFVEKRGVFDPHPLSRRSAVEVMLSLSPISRPD